MSRQRIGVLVAAAQEAQNALDEGGQTWRA
jgi:hypothetical protein